MPKWIDQKHAGPVPLPHPDWVVWFCELCGREWAAPPEWDDPMRDNEQGYAVFVCPDDGGTVIKGRG